MVAGLRGIERAKLDGESMFAGISVANQFGRAGIEVLFGDLYAFQERYRGRQVEDTNARTGTLSDLDTEQANRLILTARADGPDLPNWQRTGANAVFGLQFRRGDELLQPVEAHDVAELGIAEFGGPNPFLLFFHPLPRFQAQTNSHSRLAS